jgi:hypothetical protein
MGYTMVGILVSGVVMSIGELRYDFLLNLYALLLIEQVHLCLYLVVS